MSRARHTTRAIPIWKFAPLYLSLLVLLGLSACGRTITTQVQSSFGNVPVGTGYSPEPGTSGQPEVSPTGHGESILAGNGVAYVGSDNQRLYAFNADTGKVTWQQQLGGPVTVFAVVGGVVYASSDSTQAPGSSAGVYALAAGSGRVLWQFHHAGADEFFVRVGNGMVFAGTSASGSQFTVYGLQAGNGQMVWQRTAPSIIPGLLGAGAGVVYTMQAPQFPTTTVSSTFSALDASTGKVLWQMAVAPANGVVNGPPVESNGILYVETSTGALYAVHPASGTLLWQAAPPGSQGGPPTPPPGPTPVSPIVTTNGLVISGSLSGISAYQASDGTLTWHYLKTIQAPFAPVPVLDAGVLYVSFGELTAALRAVDGKVLWQNPGTGGGFDPPLVADGMVFPSGGNVYALKASDGSQIWQSSLQSGGSETGGGAAGEEAIGSATSGDVIYFGGDDGVVHALSASTGKQLWQYAIAELPVPTQPAFNAFITFKPGTTFIEALLAVTNLGLKTSTLCSFSWTNLDSLQGSFPGNLTLLVVGMPTSAPSWYARLKALPEVANLQANVIASCPMEPVHPSGPQYLEPQNSGSNLVPTYVQATFSSGVTYEAALEGIDGLGFRLAAPCYELARAHGDKPTWHALSQQSAFGQSHTLTLATTTENATIWLRQLQNLTGVETVNSSYTASC